MSAGQGLISVWWAEARARAERHRLAWTSARQRARNHLLVAAGKAWLGEGFPNTGAKAEHALASAIEDVLFNSPGPDGAR